VTPVHLAVFLLALPLLFVSGVVFGYGLGLALAIQSRSRNHGLRAGDDDYLRAEEKGAALLRSWLSPEQAELWDSHRLFYVVGSDTGTCYRIKYGRAMNIDELDFRGNAVAQWCFHPRGNLAVGDVLLAQKIALETMELEALARANRNWTSVPAC
jgi:hypothetical protein